MDFGKQYDKLAAKRRRAEEGLRALREVAANNDCDHARKAPYEQEMDNGYGRWWTERRERCLICDKTWRWRLK